MKKTVFNNLIKSPKKNIEITNVDDIKKLQIEFPYCESIYILLLLKAHSSDDINFTKILSTTSIYASNRESLFYFIYPKQKLNVIEKSVKSHLFEDWLSESLMVDEKRLGENIIKENVKTSIEDNDDLTTETLAKIYIDQGHYERAIQAYKILCLKYPKKSGFFANQIKIIKSKIK
jgi:hypothetical protein